MFNPILASENIKDEFIGYISTLFNISDKEYHDQFINELKKKNMIAKGPFLDISDSYKTGRSISELIDEGVASNKFVDLEGDIPDSSKELQLNRGLYKHQETALRKAAEGRNLIVTTGTGSGKTECFIIPIINHLLREAENGTLDSGVRAILIYPMNALANDQMKRLRNLLKNYPQITFGVYNSSTKQTDENGIAEYGKIYKDASGKPLKPLKNEVISRKRMQEVPPHILVTNYAMLEYMMLRPKDDAAFSGAKLRFLVLDEAHIYRGATGIETSMLLKRLKARISDPTKVLHILTSATLGGKEADNDIVKFAKTLCSADFRTEDIIRSQTVRPEFSDTSIDIPSAFLAEMAEPNMPLNEIGEKYGFPVPNGISDAEYLYDLCIKSRLYSDIRQNVTEPMTIAEIKSKLSHTDNISEQDVVNIIAIASQASKNNTPLIKARYHMFVRALEGAYITLAKPKKLSLTRHSEILINNRFVKMFECAVCDDCGRMAICGKIEDEKLVFAANSYDPQIEYYLIRDNDNSENFNDEDEDEIADSDIDKNDYLICSDCGHIIHESLKNDPPCTCGKEKYIRVRKVIKKGVHKDAKCPSCNSGTLRMAYLGYDAATSVLGTSLFEELPETEKVLKSSSTSTQPVKKMFGSSKVTKQADVVKKSRQFLSFSDSRGEAAFFASYMSASYNEFLRRRGIWHVVENNKESMSTHPWEISDFVNALTAYFDSCRSFALPGDKGVENLTSVSRKNAWIAVLNEMVNYRRSTSLVSLGIIKFDYKGNTEDIMETVAENYGDTTENAKALFDLLVSDILINGAIEGDCELTDDEREYIYYSSKPRRIKRCRDTEKDKKKAYLTGWSCSYRKSGTIIKNGRLKRICSILGIEEQEANELLQMYWDEVLLSEHGLTAAGDDEFYFRTDKFTITSGSEKTPMYICDVCGRTTMINCHDRCSTVKCDGHLKPITHESILNNNHYAKLYCSSLMRPLHIKEHTAQLGREEQQKYQEMFVNKDLNALSCSTTFEMGVDVGDLETVYLRNVPPTPANYVQRAGRAGRGRNAAAFSLTYSKLSSHDFTYFNHPEYMITGKIGVPLFTVKNEKIILRHIFAVALSDFFAKQPDVYNSNDADILLNRGGWERLCAYLRTRPEYLKAVLKSSVPEDMHSIMGINDYSWVDKLIGEDGVLKIAVDDFRNTVAYYKAEKEKSLAEGRTQDAAAYEKKLWAFRKSKNDNHGKNELIEFLVRNNILPKYGFPVDTVELYQNINNSSDKKLQMVRDLQLAISEYAPDSQVVADGKMYTSRYIRKLPATTGQDWDSSYIARCSNPTCMTWNYRSIEPDSEGEDCISCHGTIERSLWKRAIEPRKGFVADSKPKDVPMRKPEKSYRSDAYYIGDPQRQIIQKYDFVMPDGNHFSLETSANDSLMVVCNDDFYVCPHCGYAESTSENLEKANFNSHMTFLEKKHLTPWGKKCEIRLEKNKLCHAFKTDVIRIVFRHPDSGNQQVMISVMYALLEALSSVLDIERNDINGCLHKIVDNNRIINSIILYDAVAGGAGHVRRIATEDGLPFAKIVRKAIEITKNCSCSPSCYNCLRNYYNQKIHDLLNRQLAYQFLENYDGIAERAEI